MPSGFLVLLIATAGVVGPPAEAQLPHKFLSPRPQNRRFDAVAIAVARFGIGGGVSIPVVASAEPDTIGINVSWWNPVRTRWETLTRVTNAVDGVRRGLDQVVGDPWSVGISVVGTPVGVFAVYRRSLSGVSGLYVERLLWNATQGLLAPAGPPTRIPLGPLGFSGPGAYLSAGYSPGTGKLWVISQTQSTTVPRHRLTMFIADLSAAVFPNLGATGSWTPLPLGTGGFDLDVLPRVDSVYVLYRSAMYPVVERFAASRTYSGIQSVSLATDPDDDTRYAPLELRGVSLLTQRERLIAQVPGGEHPQIQSLDPVRITVDRIEAGTLRGHYWNLFPWSPQNLAWYDVGIVRYYKLLLEETTNGWARGRLFTIDHGLLPRFIARAAHDQRQVLSDVQSVTAAGSTFYDIGFATLYPYVPAYLIRDDVADVEGEKVQVLDFAFHRRDFGVLAVTRYLLSGAGSILTTAEFGYSVLDINHAWIPLWGGPHQRPAAVPETRQFDPFSGRAVGIQLPVPALSVPSFPIVENTIGGLLTLDRTREGLSLFAYTDLGDGGLRVIYDEALRPAEPEDARGDKGFRPAAVTGPGTSADEWVTVRFGRWEDVDLDRRTDWFSLCCASTTISGLAPVINFLHEMANGGNVPGLGEFVEIDAAKAGEMQHDLEMLSGSSDPFLAAGATTPRATFEYRPEQVFQNQAITFNATASLPVGGTGTFTWTFGETTLDPQASAIVAWAFPDTGSFPVRLRVSYPSGVTSDVQTTVRVVPTMWDLFWTFQSALDLEDQPFTILHSDLRLLNFNFLFDLTDEGERDKVTIRAASGYRSEIRLERSLTGQGLIHYRFPIELVADDIDVHGLWQTVLGINRVRVRLYYGRAFTPALLMEDVRYGDPFSNTILGLSGDALRQMDATDLATVLTAKPVGSSWVVVETVDLDLALRTYVVVTILELLLLLGLTLLVIKLSALAASFLAALVDPLLFWLAILIAAAILWFITVEVTAALRSELVSGIRERVESEDTKAALDASPLIWYAGEGAAEAIAKRVVEQAELATPSPDQRIQGIRYTPQLFQMIYVLDDSALVLIRR